MKAVLILLLVAFQVGCTPASSAGPLPAPDRLNDRSPSEMTELGEPDNNDTKEAANMNASSNPTSDPTAKSTANATTSPSANPTADSNVVPSTSATAGPTESKLVTYPAPGQVQPSAFYSVAVRQGQDEQPSFTYISKNQFPRVNIYSEDTSWTSFSFSGKVTVVVKSLKEPIRDCKILPSRLGIQPRINGDQVEFDLDAPAKLSVEINGQIKHPLLVFADPPETEPVPEPGPNVLYFPPGYHEVGKVEVKSGQTVYIAGGAYVKGYFEGGQNKTDVTIRGRGVLSGEDDPHKSHHMIQIMGNDTKNIRIEGITIVNSPWTNIRLWGKNNTIRNVKMISWYYNTDGILAGEDSLIEDCFFKVNDDAIKLYHSGMTVRHCVIWQLMNGAPFQLTWNVSKPTSNVAVSDCDVIRVEHYKDWDNRAVFNSIHGGTGHLSNYLFENIFIENANFRLVKLIFKKTQFNLDQDGFGKMSDITFRNITVADKMEHKSILSGHDPEHNISRIVFDHVTMNNEPFTAADVDIDSNSVSDVRFIGNDGN